MPEDVRSLLETALFDAGGESVEGAFVDCWEAYRWRAVESLDKHFSKHGFTAGDRAIVLELLRREPSPQLLSEFLAGLKKWLGRLPEELLKSPSAILRTGAFVAASGQLPLDRIADFLRDPAPPVRIAALDTLVRHRFTHEEMQPLVAGALEDADAGVRAHAAGRTHFLQFLAGAEALLRRHDAEPDPGVRRAILAHVADGAHRAGIHVSYDRVRTQVGEPLVALLIRELNHPDPEIRAIAARGLERIGGDDVTNALVERLAVEVDRTVTLALLNHRGYARGGDRAFGILEKRLRGPDPATRVWACWRLEFFPAEKVVPLLREMLGDPEVDRPAIMVLGNKGDPAVLPLIVDRMSDPATRHYQREIESAIEGLTACARSRTPAPTPGLSRAIQTRIDALEGGWPTSVAKDHDALPLHESSALYLWSIRADGTVLVSDLDTAMNNTEPVADPLARFVMILRGSRRYPELAALLDPPKAARFCHACLATGRSGDFDCGRCSGLGWILTVS